MVERNRTKHRFNQFFNHDKLHVERKQTHAPLVYPWRIDRPNPLDRHGLVRPAHQSLSGLIHISNFGGLAGNWSGEFDF